MNIFVKRTVLKGDEIFVARTTFDRPFGHLTAKPQPDRYYEESKFYYLSSDADNCAWQLRKKATALIEAWGAGNEKALSVLFDQAEKEGLELGHRRQEDERIADTLAETGRDPE